NVSSTPIPIEKECVVLCSHPIRYGPTNPPRLPIELISPTLTAAATPDRCRPGNDQKLGMNVYTPAPTRQKPNISHPSVETCQTLPIDNPAAITNSGTAVCHRRSPERSDDHAPISTQTSETRYGNAASSVIWKSARPENCFSIVGSQMPNPYEPQTARK